MKGKLNGLDLFSGYGGISLALRDYVTPITYCEIEKYAQGILLSRMDDELLPFAPIWNDVATLDGTKLRGLVDIIYGGFPCQDISVAGKGAGLEGKRSGLFYEICRLIKEASPAFVFLENVANIRTKGSVEVSEELASLGYDCRFGCISAAEVGANHKRDRWFCLAIKRDATYSDSQSIRFEPGRIRGEDRQDSPLSRDIGEKESLADSMCERLEGFNDTTESTGAIPQKTISISSTDSCLSTKLPNTDSAARLKQHGTLHSTWWTTEPELGRTINGSSPGLDGTEPSWGDDYAKEKMQTGANEVLSYLQQDHVQKAIWEATRGLECFQAEEFLLSFVCEYQAGGRLPRELMESEKTPEGILREMQNNREAPYSPLRRESAEQFFGEYPNAMRELSQLVASRSKTQWDHPLWESSTPRVIKECANRVDRIKALGNGVVPLQVKTAFEILMGIK